MSDDTSDGMTRIDSKNASRTEPDAATDAEGTRDASDTPAYEEKHLSFLASFGIGLLHLVIYLSIPTVMATLLVGRGNRDNRNVCDGSVSGRRGRRRRHHPGLRRQR